MPVNAFTSAVGAPLIGGDALAERVLAEFGVALASIFQVFGGQDSDAVVIHAMTVDGTPMAVKISRSPRVSGLLASAILAAAIPSGIPAPVLSTSGLPYSIVGGRRLSLTPWIGGFGAYESGMDAQQWQSFGALLSRVHAIQVPSTIADALPTEDYRIPAAAVARTLDERIRQQAGSSQPARSYAPTTDALIRDWLAVGDRLAMILARIDDLGDELRAGTAPSVLCHGDAHIGNVQLRNTGEGNGANGGNGNDVNGADGGVWLLDWDEVVLAPRERDLMFVIDGVLADALVTAEQRNWFFDGYGSANIDPILLAYYRCSWAMQDVADYAARILNQPDEVSTEASQALKLFRDVVSPSGIVSLAVRSLHQIGRMRPDPTYANE